MSAQQECCEALEAVITNHAAIATSQAEELEEVKQALALADEKNEALTVQWGQLRDKYTELITCAHRSEPLVPAFARALVLSGVSHICAQARLPSRLCQRARGQGGTEGKRRQHEQALARGAPNRFTNRGAE